MDDKAIESATRVMKRHEARLLSLPGVFGVGIGDAADHGGPAGPCIVVLTSHPIAPGALPEALDHVPVYAVVAGPPRQQGCE